MARGFGSTLGAGTTDVVSPTITADTATQSWALWTYRHGDGGGSIGRIFDKQTTPNLLNRAAGTYDFQVAWTTSGGGVAIWTIARPSVDTWHHILITYDHSLAANTPVIYVDGVSVTVTTQTAASGSYTAGTNVYLLGNTGNGQRNWDGMLAEFAIWNRILTASEAAAIGTKKFAPSWFPKGLVCYVPMIRSKHDYCGTITSVTGTAVTTHPTNILYPRVRFASFTTAVPYAGDPPGAGRLALLGVG